MKSFKEVVAMIGEAADYKVKDLGEMTWGDAMKAASKDKSWKLPKVEELQAMLKKKGSVKPFKSGRYWSQDNVDTTTARTVSAPSGLIVDDVKTEKNYVRLVLSE